LTGLSNSWGGLVDGLYFSMGKDDQIAGKIVWDI